MLFIHNLLILCSFDSHNEAYHIVRVKIGNSNMRIDFGGYRRLMTKQDLYDPQISAIFQKMCCKAVVYRS